MTFARPLPCFSLPVPNRWSLILPSYRPHCHAPRCRHRQCTRSDREQAARETAAIFAQATNVGTDTQGSSSATFTIDLLNRMSQFFGGMERERVEARSKIELIDRKIAKGKDTELDRLKKTEAEAFLAASEGISDPEHNLAVSLSCRGNAALAEPFKGQPVSARNNSRRS